MRDWESPEITMSPGPSIRATIGFVLWVLSGRAFSSCRRHDALEEEIRLLTFKGLEWRSRAVEERKRYDQLRDAAAALAGSVEATSAYYVQPVRRRCEELRAVLVEQVQVNP